MDNIKTWTGMPVEESVRTTEDIDKWRKYVHGVHGQPSDRLRLKNGTTGCAYEGESEGTVNQGGGQLPPGAVGDEAQSTCKKARPEVVGRL